MRSPQASKAMTRRGKSTDGVHYTALFAIACAVVAVLFAVSYRGPREVTWPPVQGTIQDTRIVADHALQTKWGGQLTWKAEYKVAYSVANREYAVWTDSGVRGESEAGVRLVLPQSRPPCRVQYNPKSPEASVAYCR